MSKVHMMLEISEEAVDEAAIGLITEKVRQIVTEQFDARISEIINDTVSARIKSIAENYASYNKASLDGRVREILSKMVANAAFESECKKALSEFAERYEQRVRDYAASLLAEAAANIDDKIEHMVGESLARQYGKHGREN